MTSTTPDISLTRPGHRQTLARGSTDVALRVLGIGILALLTPSETIPTLELVLERAPHASAGVWLLSAQQGLTALALVSKWRSRWVPWALLAMLAVANALIVGLHGSVETADLLVPGYWAMSIVVLAMRSMPRHEYWAFSLASILTMIATMLVDQWHPNVIALSDLLWIVNPIAEVVLFGDTLIVLAAARDVSVERHRRAEQHRASSEAEAHASREAARMLHDHVLHALHALSRSEDPQLVVDECRQAHEAMTSRPAEATRIRVEELLLDDPALELSHATVVGHTDPIPLPVVQAITAATHEALNNVVRHANADNVTVELEQHAHGLKVRIVDDGIGFDPRIRPVGRLGMGASIVQRMDDVGGAAHTTSAPGQGTRVELVWPRPHDEAHDWRAAPDDLVRRGLTRTALPAIGTGAVMSVLGPQLLPANQMAMGLLGLGAVGIGLAYAWVLHQRRLHWTSTLLLCVVAVGILLVNFSQAPTALEYDYQLWMGWLGTGLLHLVIVSERPAIGLAIVVGWAMAQIGGLYWLTADWNQVQYFSSTFTAGAGELAVTLLTLLVGRRFADQEAISARIGAQVRTATARLLMTSQLDQYWSNRVTDEALPLLRSVAEGHLDPSDPSLRASAKSLEASLRDELVLGPNHGELLQALAVARKAGWSLVSTLGPDDQPQVLARAKDLLTALGQPAHPGQTVTVSATASRITAVVLGATDEQGQAWHDRLSAMGGRADVDPDFVRLAL